jgi:type IV fimbrial biogenesis protein FimT
MDQKPSPLRRSESSRRTPRPRFSFAQGFTLIELLTVVAVVAVLAGIAAPSLSAVVDSVRLNGASESLATDLRYGRTEAIKRGRRVVLCKSADGASCATSGGWEQGWIIFEDGNNNALREASEPLIQRQSALASTLSLTGNQSVAAYVSFASTGGTKLIGGGFQAGTLTVCKHSAESGEARQIILNAVGRLRVQKSAVQFCT